MVEIPDALVFENSGSFLPGSIETVIQSDSPPQQYRNPFLAHAMINLNMIDTIGSGILKMYRLQQKRHFPLPEFDLTSENRVKVTIPGKVIDEKFTRLLINRPDLDIWTVMQLDKIQKGKPLSNADIAKLRRQKLIEGRAPNIHISAKIAEESEQKAQYILTKALDDSHYKGLIIEYITRFGKATREDIFQFLKEKLPDILDENQKKNKVKNLLRQMSVRDRSIKSEGIKRNAFWVLS